MHLIRTASHDLLRIMFSYLKPESVRQYPDATVRPWAICQVAEDALSFASALGYVYVLVVVDLCSWLTHILCSSYIKETSTALQERICVSKRTFAHSDVSAGASELSS